MSRSFRAADKQAGFSFIEVLVYLGLFGIFMGGMVATAYNIFESVDRNQTHAMIQEEGNFLLAKIEWALSGVQLINSPQAPLSDSLLWVTRFDAAAGNPWVIDVDGTNMRLSRSGGVPLTLNNSNVKVSNLSFTHSFAGGSNPESVRASFKLSALTGGGLSVSQDFFATKYLRK